MDLRGDVPRGGQQQVRLGEAASIGPVLRDDLRCVGSGGQHGDEIVHEDRCS